MKSYSELCKMPALFVLDWTLLTMSGSETLPHYFILHQQTLLWSFQVKVLPCLMSGSDAPLCTIEMC